MTHRPRNPLRGTRIVLYTIAALAMAWVFWRQDRRQAQMPAAPGKAEEPALQAEPPQGAASPMLVVLTREADQEEGRKLSALAAGDPGLRNAFSVEPKDNTLFLPGVMSRKKQIIPMLTALWG